MTAQTPSVALASPTNESYLGGDTGSRWPQIIRNPFLPLAGVTVAMMLLFFTGVGNVTEAAHRFPFDILAIFIALELFTAMVIGTGIANILAVRLAKWGHGRQRMTLVSSVLVLLATCTLGNNLTHVGLVLPILLVLLRALSLDRRYLVGYFACVMAIVNLAGASTPVGDFPALMIISSGITNFTSYLIIAFPLFAILTGGALTIIYVLVLRNTAGPRDSEKRTGGEPVTWVSADVGVRLLQARYRHSKVDRSSLTRLLVVLVVMFAGWVALPSVPPWAVAWGGAALGAILAPRVRPAARVEAADLYPALKIGAFLAGASYLSTTGLLETIARALESDFQRPQTMLLSLMVVTALMTAILSAGPTASALLPVAQALVAPGAALAGDNALVAIAFAGAICAGSSALLWSATAGPLIARRLQNAGLKDAHGHTVELTARNYLPWGMLNASVQLVIAALVVLTLFALRGR